MRRDARGWGAALVVAFVVGTLGAPVVARAQSAGPLVLFVGSGDENADLARAAVARRLGYTDEDVSRTEPLMGYVFGDADLWPRVADVALCPDDVGDVELIARIAEAEDALDLLEYSRAINALGPLSEALACITHPVDAIQLSRAAMLLGYASFQAGDRDGANAAFAMAAVFDPDVDWDETYPPEAQQVFNSAVLDALRARDAQVWPAFGAAEEAKDILVDGGTVPEDGALRPGLHQVAVKTRTGGQLRLAVRFVEGETVNIGPTRELFESFLAGDEGGAPAGDALVAALARTGDSEAYIVEPAFGRIYRFYAASREVREIPGAGVDAGTSTKPTGEVTDRGNRVANPGAGGSTKGTKGTKKSAKKRLNPGSVIFVAGGVTAGVGLGIGLANYVELVDIVDQFENTNNQRKKDELRVQYDKAVKGAQAGYIIAGVGGVTAAVGIPVWIAAGKSNSSAYLILEGGAEGGSVTLTGRW